MSFPLAGNMYFGIIVGFFATFAIASVLDQFGDEMFKRGVARPFFLGRYRLHHRHFLYIVLPLGYSILSTLILAGYVEVVSNLLWAGLADTIVVAGTCLLLDLALDYGSHSRGWGFIHHELIYLAVPMFVFTDFLRLAV
jgi:hypothetical protein